ncbi:MAG: dihydrolipoyl dehydrogenase [Desulfobacteraceae bacterium]|nr:dihydrolipoyl dehydrogenase [Desulfobacteraceae bacterium]
MQPGKFFSRRGQSKKKTDYYDVIVIGSGSGMATVENAVDAGMHTALVDNGPAGGTCLNLGCIPSKMLIAAADRVMEIREAERYGISAQISEIDFPNIMSAMKNAVVPDHERIHHGLKNDSRFDYYEGIGKFTDDLTLEVNDRVIKGKTIFIASGARPDIPPIAGLDKTDFLTSNTVLNLEKLPESLAIIGGGYIAAEYAHFFSAMGTGVTIFQNKKKLIPAEEPEIAETLAKSLSERITVKTEVTVTGVEHQGSGVKISYNGNDPGDRNSITAERVLIAAGRKSNADRLAVEKTGIETDERGFIKTDDYLETSRKGIWAFGDANGKHMFTHVANAEASAAWDNAMGDEKRKFDYRAAPRAVFTWPPIASVGLKEAEAQETRDVMVGKAGYDQCAMGMALREKQGFAKVIIDRQSFELLGFHIIGPHAPIVIQEVVNAMASGMRAGLVLAGMHIHPALNELVMKAFSNLK